jgi:hypothetical protein
MPKIYNIGKENHNLPFTELKNLTVKAKTVTVNLKTDKNLYSNTYEVKRSENGNIELVGNTRGIGINKKESCFYKVINK